MYHQEAKAIEFIQCLINFGVTSQGRPNCILEHSDILGTSPGRQF